MRIPLRTSAYSIPERLKEIDPRLKVYFNTDKQKYEVFGVDAAHQEYHLGEWLYLDQRVLRDVRKGYWLARNTGDPYKQVIRDLDEQDYLEDRQLSKDTEEMAYRVKDRLRWMGGQWRGWSC